MGSKLELSLSQALLREDPELSLRGRTLGRQETEVLSKFVSLTKLDLAECVIHDVSFIENLSKLTYLDISEVRVGRLDRLENLGFVTHLPNLETLICDRNHIRSLEPLRGSKSLVRLSVRHTLVSDLTPLKNLVGLRDLALDYCMVLDFGPISSILGLKDEPGSNGLSFTNCLLSRADEVVEKISSVPNNASRARELFDYLEGAGPMPPKELSAALAEMVLELPQQFDAPIRVRISDDGQHVVEAVDRAPLVGPRGELAEDGWQALRDHFDEILPMLTKENFPALKSAMLSVGRSLGSKFSEMRPIALGTHGARVSEIAKNSKHILLEEEHAELIAFANSTNHLLSILPEWREYREGVFDAEEAPGGFDVGVHKADLQKLARSFEITEVLSEALLEKYEDILGLISDEPDQNSPIVGYGILGSIANIMIAVSKGALQLLVQIAKKSKDVVVETVSVAIVGGATAGATTFLDFVLFNGRILSKLARDYPTLFGWIENIIKLVS